MDIYDYHGQLHEYIYELAYEEASQTFSHSIIRRYQKIPVWTFSNATNSFITSPNKITPELALWSLSYIPLNDGKGRYSYLGEWQKGLIWLIWMTKIQFLRRSCKKVEEVWSSWIPTSHTYADPWKPFHGIQAKILHM